MNTSAASPAKKNKPIVRSIEAKIRW